MSEGFSKLTPQDQKRLEEVFQLFRALEKNHDAVAEHPWNPELLSRLKSKLSALEESENPWVVKLSLIENHLHAGMTLKHFITFLIPVERLLQKNIQDDDFLVTEGDLAKAPTERQPLYFVLHNVRSAFNVGSIFRTAECLNATHIFLCGYTPTPENSKVLKTALGTEEFIPWQAQDKILDVIANLKRDGVRTVALETAKKAQDLYEDFPVHAAGVALIVGNERFGLDQDVLQSVDEIRRIPLRGQKNSLNVGVAVAVAGFEWTRQRARVQTT